MITIIAIIVAILFFSFLISVTNDKESFDGELFMKALISIVLIAMIVHIETRDRAYKRGQIDAINGDFKYEMKIDTVKDTSYTETDK